MKNLMIMALMFLGAHTANALQVEVAPKALQTQAQVVGIKTPEGKSLVIAQGQAAQQIAGAAKTDFDSRTQMLILTGPEVNVLVADYTVGAYNYGQMTVVATAAFSASVVAVSANLVASGAAVVVGAGAVVGYGAILAVNALAYLGANAVCLVTDAGIMVVQAGFAVTGGVISGILGGVTALIWAPASLVGLTISACGYGC